LFGFLLLGERLADSGLLGAALILGCLLTVQLLPVSDVRGRSDDKKK